LGSFVQEAQRRIAEEVELPPGYFIEWGGEFENLERALSRLTVVVPAVLTLIFVLLYMALGSARLSLLIFLNVPLAMSGGILALLLRQMNFSISAAVGFVALFGVAVLNGVVLVSHMKQTLLKEKGADLDSVAVRAAHARLRPVLMTASVASLGFIPMALSQGMGAEVQRPLATVVIGGLVTSTLLTLLVIPAVFRWFAGGLAKAPKINEAEISA
jgi:cobalt-zinc-cadmium resistance protein CzcA